MKGSPWTPSEDRELRRMAGKIPASSIAVVLGRTKNGVHHRIERLGLDGRLYGENHWNAKIGDLLAGMIGALYDAGYTVNEIHKAVSEAQDVSLPTVNDIAACRTRKGR